LTTTRERVKDLLMQALSLPCAERAAFLDEATAGEPALREEVESLVASRERAANFLERPAAAALAGLLVQPATLPEGTRVGRYRLGRVLGAGGTGTVYLAQQERPRRRVAVKVMRLGLASQEAWRRFENEAELLARLRHPCIAHVYEAGVAERDGRPFPWFAMEYVEGARTLAAHLEHARPSRVERLNLFRRIADAVHAGHLRGVIHLDLKPGNVLVDERGQPRVIDFGISRLAGAAGAGGEIVGTPGHMSPEQCVRGEVDARSDVYGLGVLLYWMLSGHLPHEVDELSWAEATRRVREEEPVSLGNRDRRLRGDVDAIARVALARDPAARYPSASALGRDVERHLTNFPVEARCGGWLYHTRKAARRHRVAFAALATTFLVAVSAAVVGTRLAAEREHAQQRAEFFGYVANIEAAAAALRESDVGVARLHLDRAPEALRGWEWHHLLGRLDTSRRTIDWPAERIYAAAIAPDGQRAAAAGVRSGRVRAWDLATGAILGEFGARVARVDALAFAPDGESLAVGYYDGYIEIRGIATGEVRRGWQGHDSGVNTLAFRPGTGELASGARDGSVVLWADGVARLRERAHPDRVVCLAFDAQGTRLASGGREGTIRLQSLGGGEARTLHGHERSVEGVAFSPDGRRLASCSRDLSVRLWDAGTGALVRTWRGHHDNVRSVAVAADGTVASASYDRTIRLWREGQGCIATLRGHTNLVRLVAFDGTGEGLVSVGGEGAVKLWSRTADSDPARLVGHAQVVMDMAESPDGSRLATVSGDGAVRVWDLRSRRVEHEMAVDGRPAGLAFATDRLLVTNAAKVHVWDLATGVERGTLPSCRCLAAGDGRVVLCTRDLEVVTPAGERLAHAPHPGPLVSGMCMDRSAGRLALGTKDGGVEVWDAGSLQPLVSAHVFRVAVDALAFDDDAARVAVAGGGEVRILDCRTLSPLAHLSAHSERVTGLAFSPDGSRIATGGLDGTLRLWEPRSGVELLRFPTEPLHAVAWSRSGASVFCCGGPWDLPGSVTIWSVR